MKNIALILLFALTLGGVARAEDATKRPVSLVAVGDVDGALVQAVKSWTEENTALPLPVLGAQPAIKGSLDEQGREVAKLLGSNDVGVVALVWPEDDNKHHGVMIKEQRVVLVNVRAMKEGAADDTEWTWRVQRQVLRGIGMLMDLQPCPDPHCALTTYTTLDQLDEIGRNFCPPCTSKLQKRAQELGIPVDRKNPFNMLGDEP